MLEPEDKKKKMIQFFATEAQITRTHHKAFVGVDNVEEAEEHVGRDNLEISVRTCCNNFVSENNLTTCRNFEGNNSHLERFMDDKANLNESRAVEGTPVLL